MGVPAFFRWLSKKYPSIIVDANEERQRDANGERIPIDSSLPNPNFQEFDNLYLDMNGIIHPCTHPEDRPAPKNEDEMFVLIFEYIDRIFSIVRPRKLLYMAIDGVAPRAKMNQQRSRRFRASKEVVEKEMDIENVRKRLEEEGLPLPPRKAEGEHFDSNCITPGTPFMARLADALKYFVHERLTNDPAWRKIQVILSDANVPGEGEHKIMDYVRRQRSSPSHNPDTVHCLCGADADLIMLGLATHETNFNIVREEFVPHQERPCELCGQYGHELKGCRGLVMEDQGADAATPLQKEKNFIFLRIPVLREYLEKELVMPNLPFEYDFERVIDDWVFLCFFVGNDFLPHLPSLEIREGAIDRLVKLYKDMVYSMRGYLTEAGKVNMSGVEMIMMGLGRVEDEIFRNRQQREERWKEQNAAKKARGEGGGPRPQRPSFTPGRGSILEPKARPEHLSGEQTREMARDARMEAINFAENEAAAKRLKVMMKGRDEGSEKAPKRKNQERMDSLMNDSEEEKEAVDEVRLHEIGWKERYYRSKFMISEEDKDFKKEVAWAYVRGLCWVLQYYYQGCVSWDWYFPYHYAPFASDFISASEFVPDFDENTKPFKPLEQLMSVFPAASKQHLPESWQTLMTSPSSPVIDFYPIDFRIDLNGKKFAWQGVALLPFVHEKRLLETLQEVYPNLTEEEKVRNSTGPDRLFIGCHHPAFKFISELYAAGANKEEMVILDANFTYGMAGAVQADETAIQPEEEFVSPVKSDECPTLKRNGAIMTIYKDPHFPKGFVFPAKKLENASPVPATLKPGDWNTRRQGDYRPQIGFSRNTERASLAPSGHRFIRHEVGMGGGSANRGSVPQQSWERERSGGYRGRNDGYQNNYGGGRDDRQPYTNQRGSSGNDRYSSRGADVGYGNRGAGVGYGNRGAAAGYGQPPQPLRNARMTPAGIPSLASAPYAAPYRGEVTGGYGSHSNSSQRAGYGGRQPAQDYRAPRGRGSGPSRPPWR